MSQPVPATPIASPTAPTEIVVRSISVDGSRVRYSTGGQGPAVVFLHGWGLGHHAYRRGLRRLAKRGFRVIAPALPGFGATSELPEDAQSLAGYAAWTQRFCEAVGESYPVVVGHSFGGGVATKLACDFAGSARAIALLNSIGGEWSNGQNRAPMESRPWWDWARSVPSDVGALVSNFASTMPSVLEDLVPNVVRNPFGVAKVGRLARSANLSVELSLLRSRGLRTLVVHSENDGVIPRSSFESVCDQLGQTGHIVVGNHSWPMTHPEVFAEVVGGFIDSLE